MVLPQNELSDHSKILTELADIQVDDVVEDDYLWKQ